jgi:hypothetical protein
MSEPVSDEQAPVPVALRIRLGVARHEQCGGLDVAALVEDAKLELKTGPVVGKRLDDLGEGVCQSHCAEQ